MFESLINDFHWLRPSWLLLAPAACLLVLMLWRLQQGRNNWQAHVDEKLLPLLLDGKQSRQSRQPFIGLVLGLIIASLAMAGPSWEKIPQPVHKTESALVIMLDLSPSMLAEDLKPSRMVRTRLKLIDLLKQRKEGLTALIVYAGESHVVTPLTDDTETIISLLPSLTPHIMPLRGSNPEMAVDQALTLLSDAGINQGELLLVTDGVANEAVDYIETQLSSATRLSILGVGTAEGAPIPAQNGGFSKDRNGAIVISKLDSRQLGGLASSLGGHYSALRTDNLDIENLLRTPELLDEKTREINREFDTWQDRGPWLVLLLLPFALLAFRRGWVLSIGMLGFISLMPAQHSYAQQSSIPLATPKQTTAPTAEANTSLWKDLWRTRDQQAKNLLNENPGQAASTFEDSNWRASAHYRAGNFSEAAQAFSQDNSSTGQYNQGNALAKAGQLEDAITAFQGALEQQQDFPDAQENLELVKELLKQKEQQEQQQDSQDSQDQKSEDQSSEGEQSEDGEQQSDQQSEQNSEQNSSESSDEESDEQQSSQSSKEQQESEADEQSKAEEDQKTDAQQGEQDQQAAEDTQNTQASSADDLSEEQRQAMEQWLRQVPDDPSGLIRRKFEHQYRQRKEAYRSGTWQPPSNQANERW